MMEFTILQVLKNHCKLNPPSEHWNESTYTVCKRFGQKNIGVENIVNTTSTHKSNGGRLEEFVYKTKSLSHSVSLSSIIFWKENFN